MRRGKIAGRSKDTCVTALVWEILGLGPKSHRHVVARDRESSGCFEEEAAKGGEMEERREEGGMEKEEGMTVVVSRVRVEGSMGSSTSQPRR